jgi:uncharacterized membrane protein YvbJ
MIFWLAKLIADLTGWDIIKLQKRLILALMLIVVGVFIFTIAFIFRACHKAPHLDQKQIQKAQDAIAKQDRVEMERVLIDATVTEQQIDGNVANAKADTVNAIHTAQKKAAGMSNAELAAELERLANE